MAAKRIKENSGTAVRSGSSHGIRDEPLLQMRKNRVEF